MPLSLLPSVFRTLFITGFSTSVIRVSLISLNVVIFIKCFSSMGGMFTFMAIICASSGYPSLFARFLTLLEKSSMSSFAGSNFKFSHSMERDWGVLSFNCHLTKTRFSWSLVLLPHQELCLGQTSWGSHLM